MAFIVPRQKCIHCGYMVVEGQMPAHLALTHPLQKLPPPSPPPVVMPGGTKTPSRQLVACPLCKSMYREDYLSTHLAQDHESKGAVRSPFPEPPPPPGSNCHQCGIYLAEVCYSKTRTNGRVPRTNKICEGCFYELHPSEQMKYLQYAYAKWGVTIIPMGFSQ